MKKPTLEERPCISCQRRYLVAWGWVFTQDGELVELDGHCARQIRYADPDERREMIAKIVMMVTEERRAA